MLHCRAAPRLGYNAPALRLRGRQPRAITVHRHP
jgi:hypothetical protein